MYVISSLYLILALIYCSAGIFVLFFRKKYSFFISFALLLFFLGLWILNIFFLSYTSLANHVFFGRAAFFAIIWFFFFLYIFVIDFPLEIKTSSYKSKLIILPLILSILSFTSFILKSVTITDHAVKSTYGNLYILFLIYLLFMLISTIIVFIRKLRKLSGLKKLQLYYVVIGLFLGILVGLLTNVIIPLLTNETTAQFGPFATIIIFGFISYSILKHRFLSLTKFLNTCVSLSINAIILYIFFYLLIIFYNTTFGSVFAFPSYLSGIFIAIVVAILINSIFTKVNEIAFFRKKYDTENFIKELRKRIFLETSLSKIFEDFIELLTTIMGIKNVVMVKRDDVDNKFYTLFKIIEYRKDIDLKIHFQQEEPFIFDSISKENVEGDEYSTVISVYKEKELDYIILLSHREDYSAFDIEDIKVLSESSERINLAYARNILTDEQKRFNEVLKEELRKATIELQTQKDEIEERYRTERDMVGIMGHELRTPLTSARGFLEMALTKSKSDPTSPSGNLSHYLDNVNEAFRREVDLINTMLSTSHADNNKLTIIPMEVDLNSIISTTVRDFTPEAEKKSLILKYHEIDSLPPISSETVRTLEVTNNIVSNAIKYTNTGTIDIFVRFDEQNVYFSVKDTGKGIPANEIENIGKKFYRIENYLSSDKIPRPNGTGLGMYVVKSILNACGGDLKIESEIGVGSTFTAVFKRWYSPSK